MIKSSTLSGRHSRNFIIAAFIIVCSLPGNKLFAQCINVTTLNATGGTDSTNGLRVSIGSTGVLQIQRLNMGQIYSPGNMPSATPINTVGTYNSISLSVGSTLFSSNAGFGAIPWIIMYNTCQATINAQTGMQRDTIVMQGIVGLRTYTVRAIFSYTTPNDYFTIDYQVTIPPGNTSVVKLSHAFDSYLGGNDNGPGFLSGIIPNLTVGTFKPGVVEAFRYRNGMPWTQYYSAYYDDIYDLVVNGGDLNNLIDTATSTDNGVGIQIDMGSTPGTYNSSSDLVFTDQQPLPIILLSFDAVKTSNNTAMLQWSTATEQNTSHFEVERSSDGKNFGPIGKLVATGNATTSNSYKLPDLSPLAGTNYYRLKTVDRDGKVDYSPVSVLNFGSSYNILLYPNPTQSEVTVTGVETGMQVDLLDAEGYLIGSYSVNGNSLTIPVKSIASGLYILHIRGKESGVISTQKFLKH
ncbi:MAG: T9SS type A sorting domain-containing protein [Taibaiella sp.]